MKILRRSANCGRAAVLGLCVIALSQIGAAQIWIASAGSVDESSILTYRFTDQRASVRPSLTTGTVTLRYNVLPAGDLLNPISQPCCEARALMVRFLDNGNGAQVIVTLKQFNVRTGQLTTLLTFDSKHYPPQPAFQEPEPTIFDGNFFNFSFAQGPSEGSQDLGGCCAYYIEAKLIRSAVGRTPGLASIRLVRVLAP